MSEKALRVVATGDMFITRRIAEDGYEGFEELSDCIKEHTHRPAAAPPPRFCVPYQTDCRT